MIIEIPDKKLEEFINDYYLYDEEDQYEEFVEEFEKEIKSAINKKSNEKKSIFKIFAEEKLCEHSKYFLECIDKELIKALVKEYEIPIQNCKLLFDGTQKHYLIKNDTMDEDSVLINIVVANSKNRIALFYDLEINFDCDDKYDIVKGSLLTCDHSIYRGLKEEISIEFYMSEDLLSAFGEKDFSKVLINVLNLKSKRGNLSGYKILPEGFCKDEEQ